MVSCVWHGVVLIVEGMVPLSTLLLVIKDTSGVTISVDIHALLALSLGVIMLLIAHLTVAY